MNRGCAVSQTGGFVASSIVRNMAWIASGGRRQHLAARAQEVFSHTCVDADEFNILEMKARTTFLLEGPLKSVQPRTTLVQLRLSFGRSNFKPKASMHGAFVVAHMHSHAKPQKSLAHPHLSHSTTLEALSSLS